MARVVELLLRGVLAAPSKGHLYRLIDDALDLCLAWCCRGGGVDMAVVPVAGVTSVLADSG
jgi:hypothetical protein